MRTLNRIVWAATGVMAASLVLANLRAAPQVVSASRVRLIYGVEFIDGVPVRAVEMPATNAAGRSSSTFALAARSELLGGYVVVAPTVRNCRQCKVSKLLQDIEWPIYEAQAKAWEQASLSGGSVEPVMASPRPRARSRIPFGPRMAVTVSKTQWYCQRTSCGRACSPQPPTRVCQPCPGRSVGVGGNGCRTQGCGREQYGH